MTEYEPFCVSFCLSPSLSDTHVRCFIYLHLPVFLHLSLTHTHPHSLSLSFFLSFFLSIMKYFVPLYNDIHVFSMSVCVRICLSVIIYLPLSVSPSACQSVSRFLFSFSHTPFFSINILSQSIL